MHSVKRVCVIGAGQMGTGIAIVAARHGNCKVTLIDKFSESLEKSEKFLASWVAKENAKGRESGNLLNLITFEKLESADFSDAQISIEAVPEDFQLKREILEKIDRSMTQPKSIIATNTSSISITKLAASTLRPERVVGLHFMNPVPVMPLVEVIRGLATSDETLENSLAFCRQINKDPAVSLDRPGFIANRLLMPYINEAIFSFQDGVASRDDIDKIMKLGTNVPMGPLALADFIGLDTCLSIMRVLHTEFGDSKYRPAPLLVQMVDAGRLGKKTGFGFYTYQKYSFFIFLNFSA